MLHALGVNWVVYYPLKCLKMLQNWPQNHKKSLGDGAEPQTPLGGLLSPRVPETWFGPLC